MSKKTHPLDLFVPVQHFCHPSSETSDLLSSISSHPPHQSSLIPRPPFPSLSSLTLSTERMQDEILHQIALYEEEGIFKKHMTIGQRTTRSPVEKWKLFGRETPDLQKFAIKILSLTCNSSGCERNWRVLEHLHTKKRNKLDQKRLKDLVFVKYNRTLMHQYAKRGKFDPISLKNIDESNEWLIGKLEDELVFDGEDLDWNVVADASGVEQPSKVIRSTHKATNSKKHSKASTFCVNDWEEEDFAETATDEGEEEDVDGYQSNDDEEDEAIGDE